MNIVFFAGAGLSAESGLQTFRDSDGYWNKYNVEDIATIEGFRRNRELVNNFFNEYRTLIKNSIPNYAHKQIANFINNSGHNCTMITQNVDDLMERSGVKDDDIYHIHGQITMAKTLNKGLTFHIGYENIKPTDRGEDGSGLRPDIIFFGERPYYLEESADLISNCDILVVIGTSLQVYPAAGLIDLLQPRSRGIVLDPNCNELDLGSKWDKIAKKATDGIDDVIELLN